MKTKSHGTDTINMVNIEPLRPKKSKFAPTSPAIIIVMMIAGYVLNRLVTLPYLPRDEMLIWGGFGLFCAGLALNIISLGLFQATEAGTLPWTDGRHIIARGPYRHSRNPIALGLVMMHIGFAIWHNNIGILLTAPFAILLIDKWVIKRKENELELRLGDIWRQYQMRVRRWL